MNNIITLNMPFKSISTLATENLPDFVVLIGSNGAGKTQLLEALDQGFASIRDFETSEIVLYDKDSFFPANSSRASRNSNAFATNAANAYLSPLEGQPPIEIARTIFCEEVSDTEHGSDSQTRDEYVRNLQTKIRRQTDFTVLGKNTQEASYERTVYERVLRPLEPVETNQSRRRSPLLENSFNGNQAALLSMAMKQSGKLPHELDRQDILRAAHAEGDLISNSISEVFTAYKIDQFVWAHTQVETACISYAELITQYQSAFRSPWEILRDILSEMREAAGDDGLFNFDFSDPDNLRLNTSNYEQFTFAAEMTNRTSDARYDPDSLSSGEKILMTLCLASFNQYLGRPRPKILLLDELDAFLHPSMLTALVKTLKAFCGTGHSGFPDNSLADDCDRDRGFRYLSCCQDWQPH